MATFGDILSIYEDATGRTQLARQQRLLHLNQAYKRVALLIPDHPDLHTIAAEVPTVANQDYVDLTCEVHSINWVTDKTTGLKLTKHPAGSRGRAQLYEPTTGKPAAGAPISYFRRERRIYLFPTPEDVRTLIVSFRWNMPQVTEADLGLHPILAEQYDYAIALLAVSYYFKLNPPQDAEGRYDYQRSQQLEADAVNMIATDRNAQAEEDRDTFHWVRPMGYNFDVRC